MSGALLSVENLTVAMGGRPVVEEVSFALRPGESLGLVGESGCGKTVTALALLRLVPEPPGRITGGRILFEGEDLVRLDARALRKLRGDRIAMIFQEPMTALNPVLTIGDQVAEALLLHRPLGRAAARARAVELLDLVGLPAPERQLGRYPHQLSGGQRQRAMIAMALACEPKLLIADEPTTALDVTIQAQILNLLRELVAGRDTALILITHDLGVVAGNCERVNVMYGGMFMETGTAEQIFARPRHPYTLGLLQSIPRLDATRKERLHPIAGTPRDMLSSPSACPFQPRCRFEVEQSREEVPELREIEPGHMVACFNPVPVEEWQRSRAAVVGA